MVKYALWGDFFIIISVYQSPIIFLEGQSCGLSRLDLHFLFYTIST